MSLPASSPSPAEAPFLSFSVSSLAYALAWGGVAPGGWLVETLDGEAGERLDVTPPLVDFPAAFIEPLPEQCGGVVAVRIRAEEAGGGYEELGRYASIVDAFHAMCPLSAEQTAQLGAILAEQDAERDVGARSAQG